MITISQLAAFAGVTVRAVRHYHARGLLPEPERDASGYRRYDAQAAVDLIRIRILAEAGVPLSRVQELLNADPQEFAAALEEIDRDLRVSIRRIQEHRRRVAELATSEVGLPRSVVDYLALLRSLGVSERCLTMEREGWIMVAASMPDRVDEWIETKREGLKDAAFRDLYLAFDAAHDYPADDPRLPGIADATVSFFHANKAEQGWDSGAVARGAGPATAEPDATMITLIDEHVLGSSPAWRRIIELVHERGLSGWTEIREA